MDRSRGRTYMHDGPGAAASVAQGIVVPEPTATGSHRFPFRTTLKLRNKTKFSESFVVPVRTNQGAMTRSAEGFKDATFPGQLPS